ncbi:MAG: arginine--tRNA ligase [Myxococcota bacterium]
MLHSQLRQRLIQVIDSLYPDARRAASGFAWVFDSQVGSRGSSPVPGTVSAPQVLRTPSRACKHGPSLLPARSPRRWAARPSVCGSKPAAVAAPSTAPEGSSTLSGVPPTKASANGTTWTPNIQQPKVASHGDYASNAALELAKALKKPPREIAVEIVAALVKHKDVVAKAEVAGPGFINITLAPEALAQAAARALEQGEAFGQGEPGKGRVLVEFVSANPTGPLHLGHARGAFVGDALARLLACAGWDVTREFYINDTGGQIEALARSLHAYYESFLCRQSRDAINRVSTEQDDKKVQYSGEDTRRLAETIAREEGDRWLRTRPQEWLPWFGHRGVQHNLASMRATLRRADIAFDGWLSEQSLHERGALDHVLQTLRQRGLLYQADAAVGTQDNKRRADSKAALHADKQRGGTFARTSQFGDTEDRIVLREDGRPVYFLADLAYHADKCARGFDRLINVFGADHVGHAGRLRAGLRGLELPESALEFVLVHMVRLIKHGQEVRLSKREGNVVGLDELLDDIGPDAARFAFLLRSPDAPFDIDVDLLRRRVSENPVFYVQYGHARMATLLQRAREAGLAVADLHTLPGQTWARLTLSEERELLKAALALPTAVQQGANTLRPHRVLHHAYGLVEQFHSYFTRYRHTQRILSADRSLSQARIAMVALLKLSLGNTLRVLGITAPERMDPPTNDASQ